jgi:inner membrane protein
VGPGVGWLLWKWKGGRLRDWIGLSIVSLFTHPLLDAFTTYGTQLLSPFSRQRFAFDAVAIIDPAYSLGLAAAIALGLWWGVGRAAARRAAWAALAVSSAYIALGLVVNDRAKEMARRQLAAESVSDVRVSAYPTLFQLPFRRIVARSGNEVRVGWLSLVAPLPAPASELVRRIWRETLGVS